DRLKSSGERASPYSSDRHTSASSSEKDRSSPVTSSRLPFTRISANRDQSGRVRLMRTRREFSGKWEKNHSIHPERSGFSSAKCQLSSTSTDLFPSRANSLRRSDPRSYQTSVSRSSSSRSKCRIHFSPTEGKRTFSAPSRYRKKNG